MIKVYYLSNKLVDFLNYADRLNHPSKKFYCEYGVRMQKETVVTRVIGYIKKVKLQFRMIKEYDDAELKLDALLKALFANKDWILFTEIDKYVSGHLSIHEYPPPLPSISETQRMVTDEIKSLYDAPPRYDRTDVPCVLRHPGEGYSTWEQELHELIEKKKIPICV